MIAPKNNFIFQCSIENRTSFACQFRDFTLEIIMKFYSNQNMPTVELVIVGLVQSLEYKESMPLHD